MTSAKTIEDFLTEVANQIDTLKAKLNDATDIIGCLQVENDDLKARLKKYEDDQGK
jgi:regulator of replication initiation timing